MAFPPSSEIVGIALRVGPAVTLIKPGQRVGVGAQSYSCLLPTCRQCTHDNETYCPHQLDTYGAPYPAPSAENGISGASTGSTGVVSQGGYASHIRTHEHWVFPVPEELDTAQVAPMLCAGLTAYSPLVRNGCGPGKKVGVVGMGGIGHFAVMFAVALGAEVVAISRSHSKEADARKMGAHGFIATGDEGWATARANRMTFDLILNTANSSEGFDLAQYLGLLDVHGKWISVGLPEGGGQLISTFDFMANGCLIGASHLGSRRETLDMLRLAADEGIRSWVEEVRISADGLSDAVQRLQRNDVRYRFTLVGYEECFGA